MSSAFEGNVMESNGPVKVENIIRTVGNAVHPHFKKCNTR